MGLFGKNKDEKPKKLTPKALWELYYKATQDQEWAAAVDALKTLQKKEPGNSKIHMKLGDALQRMGDTKGAVAAYHRAAEATVSSGFSQKALAIYKIILRLDPQNEDALNISKEIVSGIERAGSSAPEPSAAAPAYGELESSFEGYGSLDMPSATTEPEAPVEESTAELPPLEELTAGTEEQPLPDLVQTSHAAEEAPAVPGEPIQGLEPTSYAPTEEAISPGAQQEEPIKFRLPSVFSFLMPDEQDEFISKAKLVPYGHGESIIKEGESGDSMYIIKEGTARVVTSIMGREVELALLGPGDFFGEVAFLTGRPRTASVMALGDLKVLVVDKPLLQETIDKNPLILDSLVELYHSRAQDTVEKIKGGKG